MYIYIDRCVVYMITSLRNYKSVKYMYIYIYTFHHKVFLGLDDPIIVNAFDFAVKAEASKKRSKKQRRREDEAQLRGTQAAVGMGTCRFQEELLQRQRERDTRRKRIQKRREATHAFKHLVLPAGLVLIGCYCKGGGAKSQCRVWDFAAS